MNEQTIPIIHNNITDIKHAFHDCSNLTGIIPNIPDSVKYMGYTFANCTNLSSSNVYIHSNNVSNASYCFHGMENTMNIFVHENTTTYNIFYKAMGNNTYNAEWNCYLKTF